MPLAAVNGVSIHYEVAGEGDPLVLLIGFGEDCRGWDAQIPALSRYYRTIAYDHRGTGRSDVSQAGYNIEQFSLDCIGLMDHLGIERAHLVGHSMGGRVAQHLAATHPERVASLVLAATAAKPSALNRFSLRAGAYLYEHHGPEAAAAFGPLIGFAHPYFEAHLDELLDGLGRPVENPPPLHAYLGHVAAIEGHDTSGLLHEIRAPTLVVVGDREWLNPLPDSQALVAGIPDARLLVIEGASHALLSEAAEAFNTAVLRFLPR